MVRALIQPLEGPSASAGARPASADGSRGGLRPGFGLLIGAGVSIGLWAGLTKFVLILLR
jgi:hypothetical protein